MDAAFSERLRQALFDLTTCPTCGQRRFTMRQIALASGIPDSTLRRFMKGHPLRLATVDRLIIWLRDNNQEVAP